MARWWIRRCFWHRRPRRSPWRAHPRKRRPADAPASIRGERRSGTEDEVLVGTGIAMAGGAVDAIDGWYHSTAVAAVAGKFPITCALVSIRRAKAATPSHHIDAHDLALPQGALGIAQQLTFSVLQRQGVLHDDDRAVGIGNLADIPDGGGQTICVGGRDQ